LNALQQKKGEITMMGYGMMGGFGLVGLAINIAIIVGIVVLAVWAVKRFSAGSTNWGQTSSSQSPREILQARYARGELTREQYQQMLSDLS
jgi:putative membrane protein